MKRYYAPLLAASLATLAGCAAPPNSAGTMDPRGIAASIVAGRAFDEAQIALKSGNQTKLRAAGRQYVEATGQIDDKGALPRGAMPLAQAGVELERRGKLSPRSQQDALFARALDRYRDASAFLPANPKPGAVDADTLNMVGYPLADRGTTQADWQRAAQLTRLSLAEWDRQIKALPEGDPNLFGLQAARTLGALDSHAWALFRLGRVKEALQKQESVIQFVSENPGVIREGGGYSAEIPYHMAEIYRAAGREDEAAEQYRTALDQNPDPYLFSLIDAALTAARV